MAFIREDIEIYSRMTDSLGIYVPEDVCIIGVGGVGSWVAINMALLGCKKLILVDPDTIEIHNLNRTLFKLDQVGEYKVNALYNIIHEMRNTHIIPLACKWEDIDEDYRAMYANSNVIIDCRDTITPLQENIKTFATGGYDGTRCTIHYNPDFSDIYGDEDVRYRVTPSYLIAPQFIAACITNFICLEHGKRIEQLGVKECCKEQVITFDFKDLSTILKLGCESMEEGEEVTGYERV